MIKIADGFELTGMEVSMTLGDEIGIYFIGGDKRKLAFVYHSAKKALSTIKKLKKVLNVKYNIATQVEMLAMQEEDQTEEITNVEGKAMNVKRGVNVKEMARECFKLNMEKDEMLAKIAAVYTGEGKDDKYAMNRAKAVYSSIRKELGLAPQKKGPAKKTESEAPVGQEPQVEETAPEQATAEGTDPAIEEVAVTAEDTEEV